LSLFCFTANKGVETAKSPHRDETFYRTSHTMPRMSQPYKPIDHAVVFDLAMTLAKHLTKVSKANAQAACVCAAVMCSLDAERFGPEGELLDDMADLASEAITLIAERFPSMSGTTH
jgi:hypothetical protein